MVVGFESSPRDARLFLTRCCGTSACLGCRSQSPLRDGAQVDLKRTVARAQDAAVAAREGARLATDASRDLPTVPEEEEEQDSGSFP